jgi:hypothetical protein
MKPLLFLAPVILVACASTDPVSVTANSCKSIDAAILAADAAVKSGTLKGNDARNALKGLTAAQAGCVTALAAIQGAAK